MSVIASPVVEGHVGPGFEVVREAFADNFARRHELGGACCAYYRGEKVLALWGGLRNRQTGEPWERDTMVVAWAFPAIAPDLPPISVGAALSSVLFVTLGNIFGGSLMVAVAYYLVYLRLSSGQS